MPTTASTCVDIHHDSLNVDPVSITCSDKSGVALSTTPEMVNDVGEQVIVESTNGDVLPSTIKCTIIGGVGNDGALVVREISFGTHGIDVNLHLKDSFGSLEVVSCDETTCLQPVVLTNTVVNSGPSAVDVTSLTSIITDHIRGDAVTRE